MLSFENFVKSMPPSLSELKVTPSFCFAFKIRDDVAASNIYSLLLWVSRSFDLGDLRDLRRGTGNFFKNYVFEISAFQGKRRGKSRLSPQNVRCEIGPLVFWEKLRLHNFVSKSTDF